jgi:hypothetical protein
LKKRCCRSTPRCAACPVRAAVAARSPQTGDTPEALLAHILRGGPARPLPPSVAAALAELELARMVR